MRCKKTDGESECLDIDFSDNEYYNNRRI